MAAHFGDSWWHEVILLLLALEDPSLFVPFMREVVKKSGFSKYPQFVDACLDDASEKSPKPFLELLKQSPWPDQGLWERQFAALRVLEQLDQVDETLVSKLRDHPSAEIRNQVNRTLGRSEEGIIKSSRGNYELVLIPGGEFLMGSPKSERERYDWEGPQHRVLIPSYYLGRYPVTNEQYAVFLQENPKAKEPDYWADRKFNQAKQPVVGVDWNDARKYAKWAGLRLPSEAEWEYACRANTKTRYSSGDKKEDLDRVGWYSGNSNGRLHLIGEKESNDFGLYDMHGNVWEWGEDDFHNNYKGAPSDGSAWVGDSRGALRVIRGGGWDLSGRDCRSASRNGLGPEDRDQDVGFRLARACK